MSSGTIEFFMKHPELLRTLSKEQLDGLMELVRAERAKLKAGGSWLPPSAVEDMVKAVPDALVRDLVNDGRRSNEAGWIKPERGKAVDRGSGWADPVPLTDSVPGVKWIDQMIDVQDAVDRRELEGKLKRRI